eukprot:SAG31_NODE_5301_length_2621_cov_10.452022_2_plen_113_part_00
MQLFERYGTLIERYTVLIENVSALIVWRGKQLDSENMTLSDYTLSATTTVHLLEPLQAQPASLEDAPDGTGPTMTPEPIEAGTNGADLAALAFTAVLPMNPNEFKLIQINPN